MRELTRWSEAELCAVSPSVTLHIVLKSLNPWTLSCNFFFFFDAQDLSFSFGHDGVDEQSKYLQIDLRSKTLMLRHALEDLEKLWSPTGSG